MKFHDLFQGEIITKHGTYIYTFFKIIFSRTTGYFNQTWHKASSGDGDWRFVQLKGHVIPRKNISEISKTHWRNLKIFSATSRNCHGNLAQSILRWWGFKFLKWKAPPFPRGHNNEKAKMHWQIWKSSPSSSSSEPPFNGWNIADMKHYPINQLINQIINQSILFRTIGTTVAW